MDLSALEPVNKQTSFGRTATVTIEDDLFSNILLGIADPSDEDILGHDADAAHDDDNARNENVSARADDAETDDDPETALALETVLSSNARNSSVDETGILSIGENGLLAGTGTDSGQPSATNPGAAETAHATTNSQSTPGTLDSSAVEQLATIQNAEKKVLAKRAGAIEANQAHGEQAKAKLSAMAEANQAQVRAASSTQTPDTASAPAKATENSLPTSDIARLDQALRQAFTAPQATPTATPTAGSSILGANSDA
ncbi:MAG: hypothetical protein JJ899_07570, partial [Alphaproteobacteria bacterium]|nr:hypothetical protein [Alphaproteobacteria bacterium]